MNLMNKAPLGLKEPKPTAAELRAGREHMAKVKTLPCVVCGKPGPSDAHHCFHDRYGNRRASDFHVIPLCRAHHLDGQEAIHNGKAAWRALYGADYEYLPVVADMLAGELN